MTISNEVPVDQYASLECDPICREYDNFTEAEYDRLREDIRTNGLLVPILIWKGKIVDGRHTGSRFARKSATPSRSRISPRRARAKK